MFFSATTRTTCRKFELDHFLSELGQNSYSQETVPFVNFYFAKSCRSKKPLIFLILRNISNLSDEEGGK